MKVELRTTSRALSLGEAAATVPRKISVNGSESHNGKSIGEINAEHEEWRDQQPISTSCAFCDWTFEGPALDGRMAALQHRLDEHPEATVRRARGRRRISAQKVRTPGEEAQIAVETAEANRLRQEREDAERLAKIERGRQRDALAALNAGVPQEPMLEETAAVGDDAVSGSASDPGEPERAAASSRNGYTPKPGSTAAFILAELATGQQRFRDLTEKRGCGQGLISATLDYLVKAGAIERVTRGVYALTGSGRDDAGDAGAAAGALTDGTRPDNASERAERPAPAAGAETPAYSDAAEREPQAEPGRPAGTAGLDAAGTASSRSVLRALALAARTFADMLEEELAA